MTECNIRRYRKVGDEGVKRISQVKIILFTTRYTHSEPVFVRKCNFYLG